MEKKKFCDYKKNPLSLVQYSQPFYGKIKFSKLKKKIFFLRNYPKAIPYKTSYYKKNWGFCMSYNEFKKLDNKKSYEVNVDTKFIPSHLSIGEIKINGKLKKEIIFSSYLCHPKMANNESSGPTVISHLAKHIKKNYPKTKYTYKIIFLPETIGSISYIKKSLKKLKKYLVSGFVVTCVGDTRSYGCVLSPNENNISDYALKSILINQKNSKIYSYMHRGSDERQFCAPKIDLPFATFCRSKFGSYKEYHTNKDNFRIVTNKGLQQSLEKLKLIVNCFENYLYPIVTVSCEPMLSKYNMFNENNIKQTRLILDILAYCNGQRSIFEIAVKINVNLLTVIKYIKILKKKKLVRINDKK